MSQVTKPIALDETLQDVVTAIQGITQGGMIVSTGNVGSSTQPVYINGGVPTAGISFANDDTFHIWERAEYTIGATEGWYTILTMPTLAECLIDFENTSWSEARGLLYVSSNYYTPQPTLIFMGQIHSKRISKFRVGYDEANSVFHVDIYATASTIIKPKVLYKRLGISGQITLNTEATAATYTATYVSEMLWNVGDGIITNANIRQPIVTGTPTNPGTNLSLGSYWVNKSGNMVNVKITLSITGAITADRQTELITLPWKPVNDYTQLDRMTGSAADNDTHYLGKCYVMTTGRVKLGFGPFEALTSGKYIWITGNYMTND